MTVMSAPGAIAARINNRPRKVLDCGTAHYRLDGSHLTLRTGVNARTCRCACLEGGERQPSRG